MRVKVKSGEGFYLGLEPGKVTPYMDRKEAWDWEYLDLVQVNETQFSAKFIAADRWFSLSPGGVLDSRDGAPEFRGEWETFYAATLPDGNSFLYRYLDGWVEVLLVEDV